MPDIASAFRHGVASHVIGSDMLPFEFILGRAGGGADDIWESDKQFMQMLLLNVVPTGLVGRYRQRVHGSDGGMVITGVLARSKSTSISTRELFGARCLRPEEIELPNGVVLAIGLGCHVVQRRTYPWSFRSTFDGGIVDAPS